MIQRDEVASFIFSTVDANLQKKNRAFLKTQQTNRVVPTMFGKQREIGKQLETSMREALEAVYAETANRHGSRKIRANYRSVTGWIANTPGADPVQFESTLERDFAYLALFEARVLELQSQPFTLKYINHDGAEATYTPDYLVIYRCSKEHEERAVIEVKYEEDLQKNEALYQGRFDAMQAWCRQNDHKFYIVTEANIRTTHIDNVKALYPRRFDRDVDASKASAIFDLINEPTHIGSFLDTQSDNPQEKAELQRCIWSLVANKMLHVDLSQPLSRKTQISRNPFGANTPLFFSKTNEG